MRRPAIDPVRRRVPPPPPRASRSSGRDPFPPARVIPISGEAPEDVVVDSEGRLLTGVGDGRILRIDPERRIEQTVGETGGRPLGLEVLADGRVLICDPHRGLLRLDPDSGQVEELVTEVRGRKLRFCSNATAAADGSIWFTESTRRFDFEDYRGAIIEHRASGSLFRRDPGGEVEPVLTDLHFANGITLTGDGSAVLIAETDGYRINRVSVTGPDAGRREVLVDNLPGMPDNLSRAKDDRFWVAMVAPRNRAVEWLGPRHPLLRKAIWRLPEALTPKPSKTAWVICFSEDGTELADFQEQRDDYWFVTGCAEHADRLYLASLEARSLLCLDL